MRVERCPVIRSAKECVKLDMKSCVPFHEAITCRVSCMAQPHPTLTTEPCGEYTAVVGVAVKSTMTPWVSRPVTVVVQPDGVVPEGKRVDDGPSATSPSATAVLPDQILCKVESKGLEIFEGARTEGL